jgi:hypothetical protein
MPSARMQVSSAARSSQVRPVRRCVKQPEKPVQASTSKSTSVTRARGSRSWRAILAALTPGGVMARKGVTERPLSSSRTSGSSPARAFAATAEAASSMATRRSARWSAKRSGTASGSGPEARIASKVGLGSR